MLTGCGSGDSPGEVAPDPANDDSVPPFNDDSAEIPVMPPLLALDLRRDSNGSLFIESIENIPSVVGANRPWGPIVGEFAAVAYQGDRVHDAALVSFTTEVNGHGDSEATNGGLDAQQNATAVAIDSIIVYLDASESIDRIDVIDKQSNVLVSSNITDLLSFRASRASAGVFTNQPWIRLLDASDTLPAYDQISDDSLKTPTAEEIDTLRRSLNAMPIRLQQSINTLGIITRPAESQPGYNFGGTVLLRTNPEPYKFAGTLVHESGHAYANLSRAIVDSGLFDSGNENLLNQWPAEIQTAIRSAHEDMELGNGDDIFEFWGRLHQQAVDQALAKPYGTGMFNDDAFMNGFVSSRAKDALVEDIADTIRIANIDTMSRAGNGSDIAGDFKADTCRAFQRREKLEKEMALTYVKLQLVTALGLAERESFEWCVGDIAPTTTPGIDFPVGKSVVPGVAARDYTFNMAMNAGYSDESRKKFIIVGQDNGVHGIGIELDTDGGRPEGVYTLDGSWWHNFFPDNDLYVAPLDEDLPGFARTSARGVVVITYARSNDRVDGFILDVVLLDAVGGRYSYDFVPFRVPL